MTSIGRGAAAALLVAASALLVAWSLVVPIFEAPDEPAHWQYARYLHDHWRQGDWSLPRYAPGFEEANSPPLYYAAIAPFARPSELPSMVVVTDTRGQPVSLAPPRTFYDTDRDLSRYRPVRAARLVSIAFSLGTIWLCYLMGRAATARPETGLLAAAVVALLPQFTFRGMNVSNDAPMTMFAAATTLGLVRIVRGGFTWPRGIGTAAALAAAYLSKLVAVGLVIPAAFVLAALPGSLARRAVRLSALGVAALIVAPWTLRNVALYGDPFVSEALKTAVPHLITERSLLSTYFLWHFPYILSLSFVGIFGWANVMLPTWIYAVYAAGGMVASVGVGRGWLRGTLDRRLVLVLVICVLASLAIVVRINLTVTQPQGRYLFSALPALALLAALGIESVASHAKPPMRVAVVGGALLILNLYALLAIVRPAYHPPVAHDLGGGVRTVGIAAVSGFAYDPATRTFEVRGPDPWWLVPFDEPAEQYPDLELGIRASLQPIERRGCVYFGTEAHDEAQNPRTCFTWRADATPQRIAVSMRGVPGWTGRISRLRVDVLDDDPRPGDRVAFERWWMRARPSAAAAARNE